MENLMHNNNRQTAPIICMVIASMLIAAQASAAPTPTIEAMWETIQKQEKTIAELSARLEQAEASLNQNTAQAEATAEAIEITATAVEAYAQNTPSNPPTTIGGYGELHYNNNRQDGASNEIDFHRFVLLFSHVFNDRIRFFSEIELEHALAGEGEAGEVELEQAWVEIDLNQNHHLRTGVDIIPIGIVNYTHEPNTFYGVERPVVETRIIPSTWWEAGINLYGELAPGWNYDAVLHSGLSTNTNIRSGRQKISEANADDLATTGRIRYTGIPGLEISGSLQYQTDINQEEPGITNSATLFSGHIDWKHRSGFGLRALYAQWNLDQDLSTTDKHYGYYIEPAYRFTPSKALGELGIFARFSDLEYGRRGTLQNQQNIKIGLNYWPTEQIALKIDWQDQEINNATTKALNLGLGYAF